MNHYMQQQPGCVAKYTNSIRCESLQNGDFNCLYVAFVLGYLPMAHVPSVLRWRSTSCLLQGRPVREALLPGRPERPELRPHGSLRQLQGDVLRRCQRRLWPGGPWDQVWQRQGNDATPGGARYHTHRNFVAKCCTNSKSKKLCCVALCYSSLQVCSQNECVDLETAYRNTNCSAKCRGNAVSTQLALRLALSKILRNRNSEEILKNVTVDIFLYVKTKNGTIRLFPGKPVSPQCVWLYVCVCVCSDHSSCSHCCVFACVVQVCNHLNKCQCEPGWAEPDCTSKDGSSSILSTGNTPHTHVSPSPEVT